MAFQNIFNIDTSTGAIIGRDGTGTSIIFSKNSQLYVPVTNRTATATDYTTAGENLIGVTNTAAPRTITLSSIDTALAGRVVEVVDESQAAGTNNITIVIQGGGTFVGGGTSKIISSNGGSKKFASNGTSWVEIVSADNLGNHTATQALDMSNFTIDNVSSVRSTTAAQVWTALLNRGATVSRTRFDSVTSEATGQSIFQFANAGRIFADIVSGSLSDLSQFRVGQLTLGKFYDGTTFPGVLTTVNEDLFIQTDGGGGIHNLVLSALNTFIMVDPASSGSTGRFVVGKNTGGAIARPDARELFVVLESGETYFKNLLENLDAAALQITSNGTVGTGGFVFKTNNTFGSGIHTEFFNGATSFCQIRHNLLSHTGSGNSSFGGQLTANANNVASNGLSLYGDIQHLTAASGVIAPNGFRMSYIGTFNASPLEHVLNLDDDVAIRIQGIRNGSADRQFPRIRTLMASTITNGAFQIYEENNHTTPGNKLLQLVHNGGIKTVFDVDVDGTVRGQNLANGGGTNNPFKFISQEQNNSTAQAYIFDTSNTINTTIGSLCSVKNNTVEKFAITRNGGLIINRTAVAISSNSNQETIIGVTDTSVARTITLKSNDCRAGRIIIVKDESGGASINNITIDTEGSELIDGVSSQPITTDYGCGRFYSTGTHWMSF